MFAGLQDLGVANGEDLKETLTNCTEPLKAIEQFQVGGRATQGARSCGRCAGLPLGRRLCSPDGGTGGPELAPADRHLGGFQFL